MTKFDFCGIISIYIKICAQCDSLCNLLLLLYKIVVFDFIEAIKLGAVLGLKILIYGFLTEMMKQGPNLILMALSE